MQFDLRFYVVALLFIIFDVEVAFFFPWATVFGKSTELASSRTEVTEVVGGGVVSGGDAGKSTVQLTDNASGLLREMGLSAAQAQGYLNTKSASEAGTPVGQAAAAAQAIKSDARTLGWLSLIDIGVFFAVLLVGFAYVWRRGDLDWVRAVSRQRAQRGDGDETAGVATPVLSA